MPRPGLHPPPTFVPGRYRLDIFLGIPDLQHVDVIAEALRFDVLPPERPWRPYSIEEGRGVFLRRADWAVAPSVRSIKVPDS